MSEEKVGAAAVPEPRVLDAGALRALSHPLRITIFDILAQHGPQTASSLAERLGESSGATSYHLRALAKHALIEEVPDRGTGRERWWQRPRGPMIMGGWDALKTPAGRAASQFVSTELYRRRNEHVMRFLEMGTRTDADELPAMLTTANLRLTDAQFEELSRRLAEVIDDTVERHRDQQGDDVRAFALRVDVLPVDLTPKPSPHESERS
jgi:DNA-binding transcriptional ArsR family regulator